MFVCVLFVTDFRSIPLGLQQRGHATAYWCFDARIRFLLFLAKNGPIWNRLRAGGLDWGSPKLFIFAKSGPVWNRLRGGRSGLGVPKNGPQKTVHFRQKRTNLKSFTGWEVWIGGPKNCSFSPKNGPVWRNLDFWVRRTQKSSNASRGPFFPV